MIFRQLFEPLSSTYTYLLGCEETGHAILIDPLFTGDALLIDACGGWFVGEQTALAPVRNFRSRTKAQALGYGRRGPRNVPLRTQFANQSGHRVPVLRQESLPAELGRS